MAHNGKKEEESDGDCSMTTISYAPKLKPLELAFQKYAAENDIPKLKLLITKRIDMNCKNELDRAAVHFAAAKGHDKTLRFLRDSQAEFDVQDKLGMTPIHWAAYYGHVETVKLLALNYRVRLDLVNKEGMNVLHVAAYNGQCEVVDAIKMYIGRLKPSQRDLRGRTPLHLACEEGHCEVVRVLLSFRGCNIDAKDFSGRTPLHCAAECGQIQALIRLINLGADISQKDSLNRTPLHLAAETGQLEALRCIASFSTIPYIIPAFEQHNNETLLHLAARRNFNQMIESFSHRCQINAYNGDGHTALHVAILSNHPECVQALLRHNANVNMLTHRKQTPLHLAVEQNNAAAVFLLLQCADIVLTVPDSKGKTPLYLASQGSFLAITDMFIRAMIIRGLTGDEADEKQLKKQIKQSLAFYKEVPKAQPSVTNQPQQCESESDEGVNSDETQSSHSIDVSDALAGLREIPLTQYKLKLRIKVARKDAELLVYESQFRNACKLLKRAMNERYLKIHEIRTNVVNRASAVSNKPDSTTTNAKNESSQPNLFDRIQAMLGIGSKNGVKRENESMGSNIMNWLATIDAVKKQDKKMLKGKSKQENVFIPDAMNEKAMIHSITRPHVYLENHDGTYDIFHGIPPGQADRFNFDRFSIVLHKIAYEFLEKPNFKNLARELGFTSHHAKSIQEQYGEKHAWNIHCLRLLRIWWSLQTLSDYEFLLKTLCLKLENILNEDQFYKFRKNALAAEEDYTDELLANFSRASKARNKELRKLQESCEKEEEMARKKKDKEKSAAESKSKKDKKKRDSKKNQQKPSEEQPALDVEVPEDIDVLSEDGNSVIGRISDDALTFPESFDSGLHKIDVYVGDEPDPQQPGEAKQNHLLEETDDDDSDSDTLIESGSVHQENLPNDADAPIKSAE